MPSLAFGLTVLLLSSSLTPTLAVRPKDLYAEEGKQEELKVGIHDHRADAAAEGHEDGASSQLEQHSSGEVKAHIANVNGFSAALTRGVTVGDDSFQQYYSMAIYLEAAFFDACRISKAASKKMGMFKRPGNNIVVLAQAVRGLVKNILLITSEESSLAGKISASTPPSGAYMQDYYEHDILRSFYAPLHVEEESQDFNFRRTGLMYSIYVLQQYRDTKFKDMLEDERFNDPETGATGFGLASLDSIADELHGGETPEEILAVRQREGGQAKLLHFYERFCFDFPVMLRGFATNLGAEADLPGDADPATYIRGKVQAWGSFDPVGFTVWSKNQLRDGSDESSPPTHFKGKLVMAATLNFLQHVATNFEGSGPLPSPTSLPNWPTDIPV